LRPAALVALSLVAVACGSSPSALSPDGGGPADAGAADALPTDAHAGGDGNDGGVDQKCPTEIAITDRRSAELDNCGLLPLTHRVNSDVAVFIAKAVASDQGPVAPHPVE